MKKKERYESIGSLISSKRVSSQGEIAAALRGQGFKVTQASISRDLRAMGVVKSEGYYKLAPPPDDEFHVGRVSFDTAGDNLIVGRCASGLASAVTVRIDSENIEDIVGTIAGDDTIFIAVKDRAARERVIGVMAEMFVLGE